VNDPQNYDGLFVLGVATWVALLAFWLCSVIVEAWTANENLKDHDNDPPEKED
jgi:hypothetical protein